MKKLAQAVVIALSIQSLSFAASDPGQALIENFGAACKTNGGFANASLEDARGIMRTLETMKNDPDCKNVSGAISMLGNLENKLTALNSGYNYQLDIAKLEAQEVELMSQIATQTNPEIIGALESSLRSIQLDKAGLIAMDGAYSDYNGAEIRNIYAQILKTSSSAYDALASNALCLDKYGSGVLGSAISLTSSIGASAIQTNPAFGFGLASLSDFVGKTVNFFRDRGYNRSIRRVAEGSTVMQGLRCAMETLTSRYCEIQDAEDFLNLEMSYDPDSDNNDELVSITRLFDRDIPVFLNWLEKVQSGAPAANSADAGRRARVIFRQATVQVYIERGSGWFTEGRQLYDLAQTDQAKYNEIRKIINALLKEIGPGNPLLDIHPENYVPYYLLGLNKIPLRQGQAIPFDSFDPFNDWPNGTYSPDFNLMVNLYNTWIAQGQRLVTQELNQVLQPDPLQVISVYDERTSNIWKIAPATAVMNILEFIQLNQPEKLAESSYKELYTSTINKLIKIDDAVRGKFPFTNEGCPGDVTELPGEINILGSTDLAINDTDEENARILTVEDVLRRIEGRSVQTCNKLEKALEIIFKEAQLEFGPVVFKNRLETIIRVAIDEYIQRADPEVGGNLARLLAADSYLDVLSLVSGTDDPDMIREDIISGRRITINNMMNFGDTFGFYINAIFKREQHLFNDPDPDLSGPVRDYRERMCFLLASLPKWPRSVKKSYCYGLQLKSPNPKGPSSEVLTEELLNSPMRKRSCMYHDFLESGRIYSNWRIRLGN